MKIGRRIYYDTRTGEPIEEISERSGHVIETTVEDDIAAYSELTKRNRETFDFIQLEYEQYAQDFIECNGYRVNPETKELEFSYPDPNGEEQPEEPIYKRPLSEQVRELEIRTEDIELALADIMLGGI